MLSPLSPISKFRSWTKGKERDWEVGQETLTEVLGKDSCKKEAGE